MLPNQSGGQVGDRTVAVVLKATVRCARDQLLRPSQSIPLNIAEGNGKGTNPDRRRFFEIARGSALECAAIQDCLTSCQAMTAAPNIEGKTLLLRIVSMLTKLDQRRHEVRERSEVYRGLDCDDNDNDNEWSQDFCGAALAKGRQYRKRATAFTGDQAGIEACYSLAGRQRMT
ncbi:four helix bundle protein [Halochromatium roseum]|uniref:four helix bundle protein n=1 Tax=Halochromatium roseum TaxID=391920 RepID=UPI001F5C84D3|nr:four helix bundle protein [Halochromatium roseum]